MCIVRGRRARVRALEDSGNGCASGIGPSGPETRRLTASDQTHSLSISTEPHFKGGLFSVSNLIVCDHGFMEMLVDERIEIGAFRPEGDDLQSRGVA